MKTLKVTEREGRGKDQPIKKEFSVLNYPNNWDELVQLAQTPEQQATCYTLFNTQFNVFSRGKVDNGQTVEFLEVLEVTRRQASGDKVRAEILKAQMQAGEDLAADKIDMTQFQEILAKATSDLAELDKREREHQQKLAKRRREKQAADEAKAKK